MQKSLKYTGRDFDLRLKLNMFTKTLLILLMANKVSFCKSGREGALYDENVMTHSAVLSCLLFASFGC